MNISQMKAKKNNQTIFVDYDAVANDAIILMGQHHIHHLVVIENGKICGIVTDRSLLHLFVSDEGRLAEPRVRDAEISLPLSCSPDTDISAALNLLAESPSRAILIRSADKVGILTESDFVELFRANLKEKGGPADLSLANPLFQGMMRTIADIGI